MLSAAYARAAQFRRSWFERRPGARRRLDRPVVSVGNLVVGGSGKTPVVDAIARLLLASGERPAVLSRGYGRRQSSDGVVVVSDEAGVLAAVERSGDEPQMLARRLPGVPVLVSSDRFAAGRLAERHFGSTVLLLDDGFQHLQLWRNVDLVLVDPADLADSVLPSGRLREPLEAAAAAHAVLVPGTLPEAADVSRRLGIPRAFAVTRRFGPVRSIAGGAEVPLEGLSIFAVSGIARPERFHAALRAHAWKVVGEMAFRDHHWFTPRDVERATEAARRVGAAAIVTTEKDAVRLETVKRRPDGVPWAYLPMDAVLEPADDFVSWLRDRL